MTFDSQMERSMFKYDDCQYHNWHHNVILKQFCEKCRKHNSYDSYSTKAPNWLNTLFVIPKTKERKQFQNPCVL